MYTIKEITKLETKGSFKDRAILNICKQEITNGKKVLIVVPNKKREAVKRSSFCFKTQTIPCENKDLHVCDSVI